MKKRIIAFVIALAMILCLVPISSLAEVTTYYLKDLNPGDKLNTKDTKISSTSASTQYFQIYKYRDDRTSGISRCGSGSNYILLDGYYQNEGYTEISFEGIINGNACFYFLDEDRPECNHSFYEAWTSDNNGHYHPCTEDDCDLASSDLPNHTDDGFAYAPHDTKGLGGSCSVCGYLNKFTPSYKNNITVKADGVYADGVKTDLSSYGIIFKSASGSNAAQLILVNAAVLGKDPSKPVIVSDVDLDIVFLGNHDRIIASDFDDYLEGENYGLPGGSAINAAGHKLQFFGVAPVIIEGGQGQPNYEFEEMSGLGGTAIVADSLAVKMGSYNGIVSNTATLHVESGRDGNGNVTTEKAFSCEPTIDSEYTSGKIKIGLDVFDVNPGTAIKECNYAYFTVLVPEGLHSFTDKWTADGNKGHYHACTFDDCDVTDFSSHTDDGFAYAKHNYVNDKCTVCGAIIEYDVIFDVNGHGTAPSSLTAKYNTKISEPTAPTADGYTFGGWYKDSDCTEKWIFGTDTVTANTTLYAKWTAVPAVETEEDVEEPSSNDVIDITPVVTTNDDNVKIAYGADLETTYNLTDEEVESGVWVWTEVEPLEKSEVDSKDASLIEAGLDDNQKVAQYLNISLYKQVPGEDAENIPVSGADLTFTIKVPADLQNKGYDFAVLYTHEGGAAKLIKPVSYDDKTGTLVFKASEFSTYALVYTEKEEPVEDEIIENTDMPLGLVSTATVASAMALVTSFGLFLIALGTKKERDAE